jgi:fumarate reductase subunit C
MEYVYLVVACVLSIELLLRLKFMSYVNSIGRNSNKAFHVIMASNISDHWKEKMVPTYAFILLKNSLSILGIFFLIILVFSAFLVLSSKFLIVFLSFTGITISILISVVYLKLRIIFLNE